MPDSIAVIHFQPLELYPPVQNLIRVLESDSHGYRVFVYSTNIADKNIPVFQSNSKDIIIKRLAKTGAGSTDRYRQYLRFYTGCLLQLIRTRPRRILYFETLSAYPAYLYKKYFNKDVEVFIHYHEYSSPKEYLQGMKLSRLFHKKENWLYPRAKWISHTNEERMNLFAGDVSPIKLSNPHILANYPPASWIQNAPRRMEKPIRVVQIGSLGMENMYTHEFAEWVLRQNGKLLWDIYALQLDETTRKYLDGLDPKLIRFKGSVAYRDLPQVLTAYDVGVILYKGHIPNYIYNAPNKLFEYHMAGLDVWFPAQMVTAARYTKADSRPRIIGLQFENLSDYDPDILTNRPDLPYRPGDYTAEKALAELKNELLKD
jgi:hypothetical protein